APLPGAARRRGSPRRAPAPSPRRAAGRPRRCWSDAGACGPAPPPRRDPRRAGGELGVPAGQQCTPCRPRRPPGRAAPPRTVPGGVLGV
ncbi:MAG: hypothetical protein AVDCRST_MAG66-2950, partial [uncultured Pseudonocardia sp.]